MSQKDKVYNFLKEMPEGTDNKQAFVLFNEAYPEITKANFNFYRNQAGNEGVYTPVKPASLASLNKLETKELSIVPFKSETIDVTTVDMSRFTAVSTGTAFDKIASKRNGVMPGTAYIITGESGAGKTTVACNIADYLKEANPGYTAGFISCEMDKDDWTEECLDNPRLGPLETIFMLNYLEASNYLEVLKEGLMEWDFVILDSFEVVIDQLREIKGWTAKKAESQLIDLLRLAAAESNTTIFAIQQYTKGGTFVGSNKIKHMLTGMMFVRFDKQGNRFIEFVKNRRGGHMIGKPLYFTKHKETGRLEFDLNRLESDIALGQFSQDELEVIKEEDGIFDNQILAKAKELQEARENVIASNVDIAE